MLDLSEIGRHASRPHDRTGEGKLSERTVRRYFDAIIVVPLEEEFEVVLGNFRWDEDLSTETHIRFAVSLVSSQTKFLIIKQTGMGRTACQEAANLCLNEFDLRWNSRGSVSRLIDRGCVLFRNHHRCIGQRKNCRWYTITSGPRSFSDRL